MPDNPKRSGTQCVIFLAQGFSFHLTTTGSLTIEFRVSAGPLASHIGVEVPPEAVKTFITSSNRAKPYGKRYP